MKQAKAMIISKTNKIEVEPDSTRLIVLNSLLMKIFDKTVFFLIAPDIWAKVDPRHLGFRKGATPHENIDLLFDDLKLGKKGRKKAKIIF